MTTPDQTPTAPTDADTGSAGSEHALPHLAWQAPSVSRRPGATRTLLGLLGHSPECVELSMSGKIDSCDCKTTPMEDPAVAVGLVLHYARTAMTRRLPIPSVVIELLTRRVEEGDPTCVVVARWLDENGLLDITWKKSDGAGRVQ